MTKISRCLTILVTVLAVCFMGVAAMSTATRHDWKEVVTKTYPRAEITAQQEAIRALDEEINRIGEAQKAAVAAIEADIKALFQPETGREALLEKEFARLEAQAHELATQVELQARKTDERLDELKLRRDDTVRLQSQFEELVSQKVWAQGEVKRLRDLLVQARGILQRVESRRQALESQVDPSAYEDQEETAQGGEANT
ncbi:MAG: hypothetical protein ACKV0T_14325 [Planctomycetales bacterium]